MGVCHDCRRTRSSIKSASSVAACLSYPQCSGVCTWPSTDGAGGVGGAGGEGGGGVGGGFCTGGGGDAACGATAPGPPAWHCMHASQEQAYVSKVPCPLPRESARIWFQRGSALAVIADLASTATGCNTARLQLPSRRCTKISGVAGAHHSSTVVRCLKDRTLPLTYTPWQLLFAGPSFHASLDGCGLWL